VHEDVDDVAASSPAAEDDYLAESAIDRAIAVVRQLPPDMADVVMLRIVNDLPVATVAEITGQSEANVRVLAHRGLKKLAELVTIPSP
jgi:RNA polymerase sigma-70 factor (ECF subfamily)